MSTFNDYIKDKSVAVIGSAGYVTQFDHGDLIDGHDIVMRFNAALPLHPDMIKNIGSRTDILSNCLDNDPMSCGAYNCELWKELGVKWVFDPYYPGLDYQIANVRYYKMINNDLMPTHFTDEESFTAVQSAMNTRPNTGLLSVMYLLRHGIKKMFLTGFSFGHGETYHAGYKKENSSPSLGHSGIHNQKEQLMYFKNQYQKYKSIISVDSTLNGILET